MPLIVESSAMSLSHLDQDSRHELDRKVSPPIEWMPSLRCWCVFDASTITSILKSTDFVEPDFTELHSEVGRKVGIDCSALVHILHYISTANEGERHAEIRRDTARVIAANADAAKQHTARAVHEILIRSCRPGARVDLVQEIVQPVCDALFEALLGIRPPKEVGGVSTSQIFDLYLGLKRRKELNAKTRRKFEWFAAQKDKLRITPEYAAALSTLGYDSIVGTLGCSLLHVLRESEGKRLCALSFPKALLKTGVPYIERFAGKDCTIGSAVIRKGDRLRLYLDAGEKECRRGEEPPIFGRGRHSCLGEDLSTWLWRTLTAELGQLPLTCTIESTTRRKPDWVFNYYSSIAVWLDA